MTTRAAADLASGKGHRDENFPVASWLIRRAHRGIVLAFYGFARASDDIADNPAAGADEKLAALEAMRATLTGELDSEPAARRLRIALREWHLSNRHPLDLLEAFRRDVTKLRYRDWADLMDYCKYSAAPVGRFVLDVHGESEATWPESDALCSALQVINHLQDCAQDFRRLDRVYIPLDAFAERGLGPTTLAAPRATEELRQTVRSLAERCACLLRNSRGLALHVRDRRLALEIAVIHGLAEDLTRRLMHHDPLSERVHHRPMEALSLGFIALLGLGTRRLSRRFTGGHGILD